MIGTQNKKTKKGWVLIKKSELWKSNCSQQVFQKNSYLKKNPYWFGNSGLG